MRKELGLEWGLQSSYILPAPPRLQENRGQSWSFSSKPTFPQNANSESLGGGNVVIVFSCAGFLFLHFSTSREHVCAASKNPEVFFKKQLSNHRPHPKPCPWGEPAPQGKGDPQHSPRAAIPFPGIPETERTAPENPEVLGEGPNTSANPSGISRGHNDSVSRIPVTRYYLHRS